MAPFIPSHFKTVIAASPAMANSADFRASVATWVAPGEDLKSALIEVDDPATLDLKSLSQLAPLWPTSARNAYLEGVPQFAAAVHNLYPQEGPGAANGEAFALGQSWNGLQAGTLAYQRAGTGAVLFFPAARVDLASGALTWEGAALVESERRPAAMRLGATSSGGDPGQQIFGTALTISQSLVWALPGPWGAVSAAGVGVLSMLFGGGSGLSEALSQAVNAIISFEEDTRFQTYGSNIKNLATWLQDTQKSLSETGNINSYMKNLLDRLTPMVDADGNVVVAIGDLSQNYLGEGTRDRVFPILLTGVAVYLLALKIKLQLAASLASNAKDGDTITADYETYDGLWLGYFAEFQIAANRWAASIAQNISTFKADRLAKVGGVFDIGSRYPCSGWSCVCAGDKGYTFEDSGAGDSQSTHARIARICQTAINRGDVEHDRANYLVNLAKSLDAQYSDAVKSAQSWRDSIHQWNEHLPPLAPTTAPSVDSWQDADATKGWKQGTSVAFSVTFNNDKGPSALGPWSDWIDVTKPSLPSLKSIPTDPLNMATARHVYIKVRDTKSPQSVGYLHAIVLSDNKATTYKVTA